MMEQNLKTRLYRVVRRQQWHELGTHLAILWAATAVVALVVTFIERQTGYVSRVMLPAILVVAAGISSYILNRVFNRPTDYRKIAQIIERRHPDLKGLLLTAIQQNSGEKAPSYLQYRLLQQAMDKSGETDWRDVVPRPKMYLIQALHLGAFGILMFAVAQLWTNVRSDDAMGIGPLFGVTVTPEDASIEKGDTFIVMARFGGTIPSSVDLVVRADGEPTRIIPLAKNLSDPVWGGSLPEVQKDFTYTVSHNTKMGAARGAILVAEQLRAQGIF